MPLRVRAGLRGQTLYRHWVFHQIEAAGGSWKTWTCDEELKSYAAGPGHDPLAVGPGLGPPGGAGGGGAGRELQRAPRARHDAGGLRGLHEGLLPKRDGLRLVSPKGDRIAGARRGYAS